MEKYHKAPEGKKEEIECNPYAIFHQAMENCKPVVGLANIQKGGKYYQVSDEADQCSSVMLMDLLPTEHTNKSLIILFEPHPGAHPSLGQPTALPRHEVDDQRVQGQQTQTHAHVRETFPGTAGSVREGGQRYQEEA